MAPWESATGRGSGPASEMMLDLANLSAGNRVLDVAAGTGTRRLWRLNA